MPIALQVGTDPVTRDRPLPVNGYAPTYWKTLTLDTNAYAAGDVLADRVELTDVVANPGDTVLLHNLFVLDEDDQGIAFDVLLFVAEPQGVAAKNAAWATSDRQMRLCRSIVRVTSGDYVDLGSNRVAEITNLGRQIQCEGTSLWVATVSQGAGTYTANGLSLKIGFMRA